MLDVGDFFGVNPLIAYTSGVAALLTRKVANPKTEAPDLMP